MKKVAIFDIDNTVISNDSWVKFVFKVIKKSPHPFFYVIFVFFTAFLHVCHILSIEKLKNLWLKMISHMDEKQLDTFCSDYVKNEILPFVKKGIPSEIEQLKNDGFVIIFATASLEIYAKYIADFLGADIFVGTRIKKEDNRYIIDGKNCKKSEKIVRILQKIDKNDIDIRNSISFSDSMSDLPFIDLSNTFHLVDKKKWKTIRVFYER